MAFERVVVKIFTGTVYGEKTTKLANHGAVKLRAVFAVTAGNIYMLVKIAFFFIIKTFRLLNNSYCKHNIASG